MVAATTFFVPEPTYWYAYILDEETYEVMYSMPIPSRIGALLVVPLRLALHTNAVLV